MSERCPRCGAALPAGRFELCPACLVTGELPEVVLDGELVLGDELGRGGMGVVYEAQDRRLGRRVAVKMLSEELAASPELRARFQREVRALAALRHPHLVTVHGAGEHEGRPYLVMEHAGGRTLADALPLERDEALRVALELCGALEHAHARGVVHRDIKPRNVLLDDEGRARLTDFGLVGALSGPDAERLTRTGAALGTPQYMAPEALAGAPADPRMDVYAMGALLYEMRSGHPPAGEFEPLEPDLDRVVRRALARDPAKRPQTIAELRRELERLVVARVPGASPPPTAGALPPEEVLWLRAVALGLTIATAGVLWAVYVSSIPRVLEPGAVEPLVMISRQLEDGRTVAYARFETGPALAALLAVALAAAVYGLLHRHWRSVDLLRVTPDAAVPQSRRVLWLGAASCALYLLRLALERFDDSILVAYVPLVGAALELVTIFIAWVAILEARRTSRPLHREPLLWLGLLLAFVPPLNEFARFLGSWSP